jgi:hypothetical protein
MKTQKAVVILLSDKRSGSTMLQRALCSHADIQTVRYSPHTYLETHHWLKGAVMLGVHSSLFSDGKVYAGYGSRRNARTYMENCVCENVPDFEIPKSDRELIFQGWEALCKQFAQPIFFEKSPQLLAHWGCLELMLEWIKQTTYQVKVVGLVRNPLSVMYSAQELFYSDPEKRQHGWLEIHENLLRFKGCLRSDQFTLCRYEDIIQHPSQSFESIYRFVGVVADTNVGADVYASSINKWASDPLFTLQLAEPVKAMARRFNYTDIELCNPEKPLPSMLDRLKRMTEGYTKRLIARLKNRLIVPVFLQMKGMFT